MLFRSVSQSRYLGGLSIQFTPTNEGGTINDVILDYQDELPSTLPYIYAKWTTPFTKYDGTTSTFESSVKSFLWDNILSTMTTITIPAIASNSVVYFGAIPPSQYSTYSAYTNQVNVFGIDSLNTYSINYCEGLNDS